MQYEKVIQAVEEGKKVKWGNKLYDVVKSEKGGYYVICSSNQYTTGFTKLDAKDCYISKK